MSANNWAVCPKCMLKAEQRRAALNEKIETGYGTIPAEEYLELVKEAISLLSFERALREDYEVGIWNGEFAMHYKAECAECGFTYRFEHSEKV